MSKSNKTLKSMSESSSPSEEMFSKAAQKSTWDITWEDLDAQIDFQTSQNNLIRRNRRKLV